VKHFECSCGATSDNINRQRGKYPDQWFEWYSPAYGGESCYRHRKQVTRTSYANYCSGTVTVTETNEQTPPEEWERFREAINQEEGK
jgi:hypothetical protein